MDFSCFFFFIRNSRWKKCFIDTAYMYILLNPKIWRCSQLMTNPDPMMNNKMNSFVETGRRFTNLRNCVHSTVHHIQACNRPAGPSWFSSLVLVDYMHGTRRRRPSMSLSDFFSGFLSVSSMYSHPVVQWVRTRTGVWNMHRWWKMWYLDNFGSSDLALPSHTWAP